MYRPQVLRILVPTALAAVTALTSSAWPSFQQPSGYTAVNLISDMPGVAVVTDPAVKDAWGFAHSPDGPMFLVNANSGLATTYRLNGRTDGVDKAAPDLAVPSLAPFPFGGPTDVVYNDTDDFMIGAGANRGPALYIMTVLDGTIAAWRPGLPAAITAADNSGNALAYTGLTLAHNRHGNFVFAANCAQARVDVYDDHFRLVNWPGRFIDPVVPPGSGYMPFNIQVIGKHVFVAYAQFDGMEEVKLPGHGVVGIFDCEGRFLKNLGVGTDRGGPFWQLNAPWGFAIAPGDFGAFSGALLVGNFGDGAINAFHRHTHEFLGQLRDPTGQPLKIDGLWALGEGNGADAGSEDKLYFSAGPNSEADGLFGYIRAQ
jgi:uncharacterized protein (TIGR03118 family)